jgi:integrase
MPTAKITKTSVDNAGPGFLWDDVLKGFGLRVTEGGSKSYIFQYRMAGGRDATRRRYTIGKHGKFTPEAARAKAKAVARQVEDGIDPGDEKSKERRQAVDLAFEAYIDTFTNGYLKANWKRWEEGKRLLEREPLDVLKKTPLTKITRKDVAEIMNRLAKRQATARLTFATLRKLFRYAVDEGDLDRSPIEAMRGPKAVASRDRVLAPHELGLAWHGAGEAGDVFTSFFRLLIATGQRRSEVSAMDWSELSRSEKLWTLPPDRVKNSAAHLVHLNSVALMLLDGLANGKKWPTSGLVLTTTGETPISGISKAKARLDAAMIALEEGAALRQKRSTRPIRPWRLHDFRRTLVTGLQKLGVRFEVTEAVVNHISGAKSGVAGVYQRHDWKEEKQAALEAWSKHLAALIKREAPLKGAVGK